MIANHKSDRTSERRAQAMLKPVKRQSSFYDADYICEQLIPQDSFYRKFREIVSSLIKDEQFDSMYCKDNGRPAISPSLLAMATILQFHKNLSDREMEQACMYDIQIKYALGLALDERPFDHSSLGDFRKRLLENGKEKEIFERILSHLIKKGLIEKNEIQRIDATHVIADIAVPTMVQLVKKSIFEILKPLKGRYKEAYGRIASEIEMAEYTRETINSEGPGRPDSEKRKRKLVEVVNDARVVLRHTRSVGDRDIRRKKDILRRILQENLEKDETGDLQEKPHKDKPKDLCVSPVDPDARFGRKSDVKKFIGYKANVTETVASRFITNIVAMPGNRHDGRTAVEAVIEQEKLGLVPSKVIGDTAYGEGAIRKQLKEHGSDMVAPLCVVRSPRTAAVFPKSMFKYNEKKNTLTCPQGVTVKQSYHDYQKDIKMFHFPMPECNKCSVQRQCTNDRDGRRTVGISSVNAELREAEIYNCTEQFKAYMKLRPPIEGKLSELTRYHGLRRARYRGLNKVGLQFYFTAAAVNIKRWIKILMNKMKPKIKEAWAV
jgi:transposase